MASGAAIQKWGDQADVAGQHIERMGRRSFIANQTIFTMRRVLYGATLGLVAAGGAAAFMGLKFESTLERSGIALGFLLGNQQLANQELQSLLDIARKTTFLPEEILSIGQSFIGFGFSAEQTNRTLMALGDTIAALNLPHDTVQRVIFALGQIGAKGRLMGEEIRQLANANIPIMKILNEQFGDSVTQLNKIGDAQIPADIAINAIIRGLENRYQGASEKIAKTVSGQVEILRGDLQMIFGGLMMAPFQALEGNLPRITAQTRLLNNALRNEGFQAFVVQLDKAVGAGGALVFTVNRLNHFFSGTFSGIAAILSVLKPFIVLFGLGILLFADAVGYIGDFINWGGKPLAYILRILIALWLADIAVRKWNILITKQSIFWKKIEYFWMNRLVFALRIGRGAYIVYSLAVSAATYAGYAFGASTVAAGGWILLAAAAVIILAGVLVYLYVKYENLRKIIIAVTLVLFPLLGVGMLIHNQWERIGNIIQWVWDKMKGFANWVGTHKNFLEAIPGAGIIGPLIQGAGHIPGLADGGITTAGGLFKVHRDELLTLPAGTAVSPISPQAANLAGVGVGGPIQVTITPAPVIIDGRQVTEVVFEHRADRIARR